MRSRLASIVLASSAFVLAALTVAGPASAETWGKNVSCGTNNRCAISSNSSTSVQYFVDNVVRASWGTGGAHTWNGAVSAGTHPVLVSTPGTLYSHNAYCYCPPGSTCAV
jgi:hypothetical protein